jgi:hypothetical protein
MKIMSVPDNTTLTTSVFFSPTPDIRRSLCDQFVSQVFRIGYLRPNLGRMSVKLGRVPANFQLAEVDLAAAFEALAVKII